MNKLVCNECNENDENIFAKIPGNNTCSMCVYCGNVIRLIDKSICTNCNERTEIFIDKINGESVCKSCGNCEQGYRVFDFAIDMPRSCFRTYKRSFYFNEKISQFLGEEPKIPPYIQRLLHYIYRHLLEEGKLKKGEIIPYDTIRRLFRSIGVNTKDKFFVHPRYVEMEKSKKFKKNNIKNLQKYAEKWITINHILIGIPYPNIDASIIRTFRRCFAEYQKPFELFRHSEECFTITKGQNSNCHKNPNTKCRYAIININLLISIFLLKHGLEEDSEEYKNILFWWPQLSLSKRKNLVELYIKPIEIYLGCENKFIPKELQ